MPEDPRSDIEFGAAVCGADQEEGNDVPDTASESKGANETESESDV